MLKIENFSYGYSSRADFTLHNLNLELHQGEMLLVAGHSGCGKSTLIKAISGLLSGEKGRSLGKIYLDGMDVAALTPEAIGLLAGTVYQSPDDQLFAMTVGDEVGFALENQGLNSDFISSRVTETLNLVGLSGFEEYGIHQLSGGQRQRLALASILITKPKLLILDEPVSQMNPQGVKSFMELLLRLNKEEHISILMIEHRVNELAKYFSRLAVMEQGRIIYDGAMDEAWSMLTDKSGAGIREPQSVKLCRFLKLPNLTSEEEKIVEMIHGNCEKTFNVDSYGTEAKINEESSEAILKVDNVIYTYPGSAKPILKNLSFSLPKGKIVALMGYNGAGKSTLMNILGGLSNLEHGSIKLDGKELGDSFDKIGYLRQEPDLMLLADTVEEELKWNNKTITDADIDSLLEKLKLGIYRHDFPLALSKGQRLRVVLGAMLARKPQLLLLDEPTTGQDEESLREIKQLLLAYRSAGGSVFICTHDVELAAEIADSVLLLKNGEIMVYDYVQNVLTNKQFLLEGGLSATPVLRISEKLEIPPCVLAEEVKCYVSTSAVGGE